MTIALWALGVLLVFGGFMWWSRKRAPVGSYPRLHEDNEPEDLATTSTFREKPEAKVNTPKRKKPRRKGYAGHGRIPRTGGWF